MLAQVDFDSSGTFSFQEFASLMTSQIEELSIDEIINLLLDIPQLLIIDDSERPEAELDSIS
jgi:hypothetical protein